MEKTDKELCTEFIVKQFNEAFANEGLTKITIKQGNYLFDDLFNAVLNTDKFSSERIGKVRDLFARLINDKDGPKNKEIFLHAVHAYEALIRREVLRERRREEKEESQ